MRRILRLRWIELHLDCALVLVNIERPPESLVAFRDHLHANLPLRHLRNLRHTLLARTASPKWFAPVFPSFTAERPPKRTMTSARSIGLPQIVRHHDLHLRQIRRYHRQR